MKEITKTEIDKLLRAGIVRMTHSGLVNDQGIPTGFRRTKSNCYIENKYVDMAQALK